VAIGEISTDTTLSFLCRLHLSMLGLDASIKHYLNAIKTKQSALNSQNPWSAVGNRTSALGPSGSSFGPSGLVPIGIHHLLLSNLTTAVEGPGGDLTVSQRPCMI